MASRPSPTLLATLRRALAEAADASKAPAMQAYMKSTMPYHGVAMPVRRPILKRILDAHPIESLEGLARDVRAVWNGARFREERYAAMALLAHRNAKPFQTPEILPLYEELIVTGAWWDYVDELASHGVGGLLKHHPKPLRNAMLAWSRKADIWQRRTSILAQLHFKDATDLDLLYACIEPSLGEGEFFLRKAIGWALRDLAWSNPDEVVRYVTQKRDALSPLSKREALKNLLKSGKVASIP